MHVQQIRSEHARLFCFCCMSRARSEAESEGSRKKTHEDNPEDGFKPGRWLGVSHRVGSALCYWVLAQNGYILSRTTVQHIPKEDMDLKSVKQSLHLYD